jgi:ergothioneine biosynthesis protein EgtB
MFLVAGAKLNQRTGMAIEQKVVFPCQGPRRDSPADSVAALETRYRAVRRQSEQLCEPLQVEDYVIQSMADASPVKWHLAHTSWFFETFVLTPFLRGYQPFHAQYGFLFNSYYNSVGPRWSRPERGLLSRPTVAEIYQYRAHVDEQMRRLFQAGQARAELTDIVVLGLNHEQQHQELLLTDLKHAWAANPLHPVYHAALPEAGAQPTSRWVPFAEGLAWIGHEGQEHGFAFDNESPRHRVFLEGFELASRLVSNAEYLAFIEDGGYERAELWLSDGWATRQTMGWTAPLYWAKRDGIWQVYSLAGMRPLNPSEPVCHLSCYEADAFARWAGARLPTEAEWERAAGNSALAGHFAEGGRFHPAAAAAHGDAGPLHQLYGDVWQWTASPYVGYPGYRPARGALGEYNGKFMCNQLVLRGASCATPRSHARVSYRNFFSAAARWQFSGIRLAKDFT